jgi:hypothetical protein
MMLESRLTVDTLFTVALDLWQFVKRY